MQRMVMLLLLSLFSLGRAQEAGQRVVLDEIAAVVGDEIIPASEIKQIVLQAALEKKIQLSDTTALRKLSENVLNDEIAKKILLHQAKEAKIEVTDDEVSQMVANQINDLRNRYPNEQAFQRDMAAAGQTMAGLKDMYREQARDELLRQNFLRNNSHEFPRVKVTDEEARAFFENSAVGSSPEQIKFQHLVIAPRPSEEVVAKAKTKIDSVYKMLQAGADFAYLAEKFSDDPSAPRGGDLGFFSKGDMVKEFEESAFAMHVGEVRMVKTKYGWHLIRVEARRQKEVRARHILAATEITPADWERASQLAVSLRQRVLNGENFYKLAKEFSEDAANLPESPPLMVLESLEPNVRKAVDGNLTPVLNTKYRLSDPVEAKPNGYLVVLELERKPAAPYSFEEVRQQILERLQQSKSIDAYIEELRKKTYVDIRFKGWVPLAGGL